MPPAPLVLHQRGARTAPASGLVREAVMACLPLCTSLLSCQLCPRGTACRTRSSTQSVLAAPAWLHRRVILQPYRADVCTTRVTHESLYERCAVSLSPACSRGLCRLQRGDRHDRAVVEDGNEGDRTEYIADCLSGGQSWQQRRRQHSIHHYRTSSAGCAGSTQRSSSPR